MHKTMCACALLAILCFHLHSTAVGTPAGGSMSSHGPLLPVLLSLRGGSDPPPMGGAPSKAQDEKEKQLYEAAIAGEVDTVKKLLNEGIKPDSYHGEDGSSALLLCSESGRADVVSMLLKSGADVNHQRKDGASALIAASAFGRLDTVDILLDNGADIELVDNEGVTALMFASDGGRVDVVARLIQARANPDHASRQGKTALMWASYHGNKDVVFALLDSGASPYLADTDGVTALDIIQEDPAGTWASPDQQHTAKEIIEYYREMEANTPDTSPRGEE
jgi:ankyrin repeat protein